MRYEIRYVEWIDSCGSSGWKPIDEISKIPVDPCRSIGFVLGEDARQVVLVQSVSERGDDRTEMADNSITIPKVAIVKSQTLKAGRGVNS